MEGADTKLHEAVRYGDTNLVLEALKEGYDPNQIGLLQWNCLHEAANNDDLEILEMLLQYNGDPNLRDELHGSTPVHYAAQEGYVECLQALVEAGGVYDVKNDEGLNCLDVAVGKCRQILDKQRIRKMMRLSPKDARKELTLIEGQGHRLQTLGHRSGTPGQRSESKDSLQKENVYEWKNNPTKKAWEEIEFISSTELPATCEQTQAQHQQQSTQQQLPRQPPDQIITSQTEVKEETENKAKDGKKFTSLESIQPIVKIEDFEPVAGRLQLSFEYNSKTSILKIRVWHIEDLLLPPVEASMISKVYVKSYLLPDKKGESKRRTEEHRIEEAERSMQTIVTVKKHSKDSTKAIFQPSRFKFTKALEYKKVGKDMVENRTVHISVCVKQKYSNRSFVIANCQVPLKTAVRKLKRESFGLTSCINPTIPSNLHLYSPKQLIVVNQGLYSNITASDPNLRKKSLQSLAVDDDVLRASSEGNLREVKCQSVESIPSIVINMPGATDEDYHDALQEIAVMGDLPKRGSISHSHPELTVIDLPGSSIADSSADLQNVVVVADKSGKSSSSPDVRITSEEFREIEREVGVKNMDVSEVIDLDEEEIVGQMTSSRKGQQRQDAPKPGYAVDLRKQVIQVQVHSDPGAENKNQISTEKDSTSYHTRQTDKQRINESVDKASVLTFHHVDESSSKSTPPRKKKHIKLSDTYNVSQTIKGLQPTEPQTGTPELTGYRVITEIEKGSRENDKPSKVFQYGGKDRNINSSASQRMYSQKEYVVGDIYQGASRTVYTPPQPIIHGLQHTTLTEGNHSKMEKSQTDRGTDHSKAQVLLSKNIEETPQKPRRLKKTRHKVRQMEMVDLVGKEKEKIVDKELQKKLTTSEFKLQMFQRTRRDPHPATPGLTRDIDTSETDQSDPFFVPGTPVQSPVANEKEEGKDDSYSKIQSQQMQTKELRRIESPAISRVKASWI